MLEQSPAGDLMFSPIWKSRSSLCQSRCQAILRYPMKKRKKRSGRRIRGSLARTPTKTKTKTRNVKRKKKGRRNERRLSFKYSFCIPASLALQLSLKAGPDSYFQKKLDIELGSANDPRTFPTTTQLQKSLMPSIGLRQFIAKSIETCANIWILKGCTAISPAHMNLFHITTKFARRAQLESSSNSNVLDWLTTDRRSSLQFQQFQRWNNGAWWKYSDLSDQSRRRIFVS